MMIATTTMITTTITPSDVHEISAHTVGRAVELLVASGGYASRFGALCQIAHNAYSNAQRKGATPEEAEAAAEQIFDIGDQLGIPAFDLTN